MKLFENEAVDDEVEKALNYLITMPQSEQFLESVKSSGKKLCMDMSPGEREKRINEMVSFSSCFVSRIVSRFYNFETSNCLSVNAMDSEFLP